MLAARFQPGASGLFASTSAAAASTAAITAPGSATATAPSAFPGFYPYDHRHDEARKHYCNCHQYKNVITIHCIDPPS